MNDFFLSDLWFGIGAILFFLLAVSVVIVFWRFANKAEAVAKYLEEKYLKEDK